MEVVTVVNYEEIIIDGVVLQRDGCGTIFRIEVVHVSTKIKNSKIVVGIEIINIFIRLRQLE